MSNDLITWNEEPAREETWTEILGTINEDEARAFHRTAVEEAQKQAAETDLYKVSESELLERWQKEAQKLEAVTLEQRQIDAVHRFLKATPEFVCNPRNQQRIDKYLTAAGLDASDPSHFDAAYKALSARNLLEIDESKRVRAPYQRYTEADLQNMDLDQLEELARQSR